MFELMWGSVTLLCYLLVLWFTRNVFHSTLLPPLFQNVALVGGLLWLSQTPVQTYVGHTTWLTWLVLPATTALAIPIWQNMSMLGKQGMRILGPILIGGLVTTTTAVGILYLMDVPFHLLMSMMTKSVTTPIAMTTSEFIQGVPEIAAFLVAVTGAIGVALGPWVFKLIQPKHQAAVGLTYGTIAHALGTAHCATLNHKAVTYASVALCANGVATAFVLILLF